MNKLTTFVGALLLASRIQAQTTACQLAEYGFNLDGATSFPSQGQSVPAGVNLAGFNPSTGLGTVSIRIASPGAHYVGLLLDHEIDQATNTFFNEFGAAARSPATGQAWEIAEPGYRGGALYTNFLAGTLHNTNRLPASAPDDVAMALAWNFTLAPGETGLIQMTAGGQAPPTGFYLAQTDPQSGQTLYFSSTLQKGTGDTEPPSITCPANMVLDADPGLCLKTNVTFEVTATDNLPGVTVTCTPPSGSTFPAGLTTVRCVATDAADNTNTCSFTVTVRTPPVIQCPPNIIVECAPPGGQRVDFTVTATSACGSNLTVVAEPPSGSIFPLGATAVRCTATDSTGNSATCSFAVLLIGTNCAGDYSLFKQTHLAGEVHADPLLQPYPCGMCVELTGVPAQGWTFMGWLGDARGTDPTVTITMTQNKCVEAVFGTGLFIGATNHGVAWLDPVTTRYASGAQARALARPDIGYYFNHWTNTLNSTLNPYDFTIARTNVTLTPVFLPLPVGQFAMAVDVRGNGRVRGQALALANRYPSGSNVLVRAVPDAGQLFEGWAMGPVAGTPPALVTNNPITVLMDTNKVLTAFFTGKPWIEIVSCQDELPKGLFRMKIHGRQLEVYAIEAAPVIDDPSAWREIGRDTNVLGAVQYEDPYVPEIPQRFYRARLVP